MYLKRIELAGFKTFPDHTEVVLSPGVTAVVGPNGCGKSNLMDAVRWVLGEQRARVLRGGKMEEVIFSGTAQRAGMSSAEVTLIIDNHSGRLPTEYADVAVRRRVDRSGQSDYFLNGAPCRLKDLHDLFLDTGMGSHGYAVIHAAMIDAILSDNPEERRFLFEEAAGVSKYKLRQKVALRKMEATEQDLIRLTDLKNEVATRARSLARQKGMAERHSRLRESCRALEIVLIAREYSRLAGRVAAHDAALSAAQDEVRQLTARCDAVELEVAAQRLKVDEAERLALAVADRLAAAATRWHEHQTERVRTQDRRRHLEEERGRIDERRAQLTARLAEADRRGKQAELMGRDAAREGEQVASRLAAAEADYQAAADEVAAATDRARRSGREEQLARDAHMRAVSRSEARWGRREEIERHCEELRQRQERLNTLLAESRLVREGLATESAAARIRLDEIRRSADTLAAELAALETRRAAAIDERQRLAERLAQLRASRDVLASLMARGEGLGTGVGRILSDATRWGGRVHAWVDRLHPDPDWERAVASALADRLSALVCDDPATATDIIALSVEDPQGRVVVLDTSQIAGSPPERPEISDPGFTGWLADRVQADGADRIWVDTLLGAVATAHDATEARRLFEALGRHVAVAARDGVVFSPPGVIAAGSDTATPPLGRADRVREYDAQIAPVEAACGACEDSLRRASSRMESLQEKVGEQRRLAESAAAHVSTLQAALEAEQARSEAYLRQLDELETALAAARGSLDEPGTDGDVDEDQLRRDHERLDAQRREDESTLARAEERLQVAVTALNNVRIEAVEVQARAEAAQQEARRAREMSAEIAAEQTELEQRLAKIAAELAEIGQHLTNLEQQEQAARTERDRLEEERLQARAAVARLKDVLARQEADWREARHERERAERRHAQIELERSGSLHEVEECRRRALELQRFDPSSETVEDRPDSDETIAARAASLRQTMERLGPVNPLALEDYQREKERWTFLERQVGDLRQAKASLAETIAELNRTAGERFLATFGAARAHFQNVFTELFHGGEADVILADPERPLESPIEVFARPRGKKFIGIRQLSGGERALTALALLFGLYLVKPSPFCIFDEVDAPLDDANCGRFLRLIDRFKGKTQFIVVTHNKLTMEAADVLYGITMEEPGISRIVSVRLDRGGEGDEAGLAEPRFVIAGVEAGAQAES